MLGRFLVMVVLLAPATVGFAQAADAACRARDAKGTWEVFSIWTDQESAGWTACTLALNARGGVKDGRCEDQRRRANVTAGRLRVASSCAVAGSITVGGIRSILDHAQMARDKLAIHGVGHDSDGSIWKFSAVKR